MAKKLFLWLLLPLLALTLLLIGYYQFFVKFSPPEITDLSSLKWEREQLGANNYQLGSNWLRRNKFGLWEMYVEGKPFERGVANGKLSQELIQLQEEYFVASIKNLIPSESYLNFLKYFTVFFNRNMPNHVRLDYQQEIYGISHSFSPKFNYIGTNYERNLNYHAAHDIGHALQEMGLVVGCTSFSVWGDKSEDGSLLIGRNFDFYTGDDFAKDKIVQFTKPDAGYGFMTITWGGFIGAASGMNEKGLTVTINAAKSDFPTSAATPISLLAREILQFASNIQEAYAIAQKRKTFVAESIMIGSASDGKTAIIEKSPNQTALVYPTQNSIVCSNHYQSKEFNQDARVMDDARATTSEYRLKRVNQLLNQDPKLDVKDMAFMLRNQLGLNNDFFGYGNEKAINQLICHHSVIFKPEQKLVWVSTQPFQLGEYVCYDLGKIFSSSKVNSYVDAHVDSLTLAADTFLFSTEYKKWKSFHHLKQEVQQYLRGKGDFNEVKAKALVANNPELYQAYWLAGDFYAQSGQVEKARKMYQIALSKQIPRISEKESIEQALKKLE
ncbi:MAG: C45 family peptidase [Bacteroidia bacterium]|nr:C45 family peptidase [Bacteroidia bacterium]